MRKSIFLLCALLCAATAYSQNTFRAVIKDSATNNTIIGATIVLKGTTKGAVSDIDGKVVLNDVPDGIQTIVFSAIGYKEMEQAYNFPLASAQPVEISMQVNAEELEEIIIEGTRSNRSIATIPTRVEVLTEEIDEASTMDPSKVSHLLTHSTGIQVQYTSATSNTANVRIQGMEGQYAQILKDGFPLYGGFSGNLSIMQIPPLDLRQVEYIKGSASTLYGGGAISGLINLISKRPEPEETIIHLNASQLGARDVNTYVSRKIGKMGLTLLAQRNEHLPYDVNGDGYTDLPHTIKYNLNPRLFYDFSPDTRMWVGATFTDDSRDGGDMDLLNGETPTAANFYREQNEITRTTTQLKFDHDFDRNNTLTLKNSFNIFNRSLSIIPAPTLQEYKFAGTQVSSFSEVSLTHTRKKSVLIAGLNYYTDKFTEEPLQHTLLRNEGYNTIGAFANYTFDVGRLLSIESGLRTDYVTGQRLFVLPRVFVLFKWTDKLTTRIGGGLGYRNPTIFNQESETLAYQNILAIDKTKTVAEQSYGGSADIGYKTPLGDNFFLTINQMFFYTYLDNPLVLTPDPILPGYFSYRNANGFTRSYGAETFFKLGFYDFVLFVGYTYTNATQHYNGTERYVPLTPMHSLKGDLLYSLPGKWRIAVDYEYKSPQKLSNGITTSGYWTYGAVVEYTWKNFSFFGNVENFTNVRQSEYMQLTTGPYDTPQFTEVWAPLDGVVFNGGLKIRL